MHPKSSPSSHKSRNKFNYHSQPAFPIPIDEQLEIVSLQISEHGRSGGVIFVESNKGAFVLKANNQAAQDFFYNELALYLDVNVPQMRTIGCYEPEFQKLVYLIQKYCHTDQVLYARLKTKLDFPFYQLLQYIPSISLAHSGLKKYTKNMLTLYKIYSVGLCLAYDMVINNNDRFALVWRGEGNINNILIEILEPDREKIQRSRDREDDGVKLGDYYFIDHDGHLVDTNNEMARGNAEKYMDVVSEFHLNMIQFLRKENSSMPIEFEKLIKQVSFFTKYKYRDEELIGIMEGIIYCTKKFIDFYEAGEVKVLHESIQKPTDTKIKEVNYWNEYWNNEFKKVNLNFCELFYIKISAIYTTYPELINEIYERVKKCIEENKNVRKRRPSEMSRKNSEFISNGGEGQEDPNENKSNKDKPEQESDNSAKNRRRWRQKLVQFKQQNYK